MEVSVLPVSTRSRPHPAKVRLYAEGRTIREFADFHGCSEGWAYQVLSGRARAPRRFRSDLATFLNVPERLLFDEEALP